MAGTEEFLFQRHRCWRNRKRLINCFLSNGGALPAGSNLSHQSVSMETRAASALRTIHSEIEKSAGGKNPETRWRLTLHQLQPIRWGSAPIAREFKLMSKTSEGNVHPSSDRYHQLWAEHLCHKTQGASPASSARPGGKGTWDEGEQEVGLSWYLVEF